MDLRIGVIQSARELELEIDDSVDRGQLREQVQAALNSEGGVLWLTDRHAREVAIPVSKVAYVEFGRPVSQRSIGFSG